jgi:hypothetical protein
MLLPKCTQPSDFQVDDGLHHSGTNVGPEGWLCIDCALRERDVLIEALQGIVSYMHGRPDIKLAMREEVFAVEAALATATVRA